MYIHEYMHPLVIDIFIHVCIHVYIRSPVNDILIFLEQQSFIFLGMLHIICYISIVNIFIKVDDLEDKTLIQTDMNPSYWPTGD